MRNNDGVYVILSKARKRSVRFMSYDDSVHVSQLTHWHRMVVLGVVPLVGVSHDPSSQL